MVEWESQLGRLVSSSTITGTNVIKNRKFRSSSMEEQQVPVRATEKNHAMIKGSIFSIASGILPSSSVVTKVPLRIRLSLKLVTESATVSTPPLESAISITQGGRAYKNKAESFLNMFRDYGFEDSEIQKLSEYPKLGQASVENLKRKLDFFVEIGFTGWSDEQLSNVCKTYPAALGYSEENIRSKMRFYVNTLKVEPETVISNPMLLGRSADIVYARYEVLKILKSQKLIRGASAAKLSEDLFLNRYVIKHEDSVPGLLVMYYDIADGRKNKTGT